jgi:30S ribosomal protein S31
LSPELVSGLIIAIFYGTCTTKINNMGRGDKKTKKGKTFKGSFGKSRPASEKKTTGNTPAAKKEA